MLNPMRFGFFILMEISISIPVFSIFSIFVLSTLLMVTSCGVLHEEEKSANTKTTKQIGFEKVVKPMKFLMDIFLLFHFRIIFEKIRNGLDPFQIIEDPVMFIGRMDRIAVQTES